MNFMLWLVTGALVAWLASFRDGTVCMQRLLVEAGFAVLGALLGGALALEAADWFSTETHWGGIAAAGIGAAVLLLLTRLRSVRDRDL
jgi:uncharacterized membrane protein YeaQ/YmgE (transglycosylase-associated protein family)